MLLIRKSEHHGWGDFARLLVVLVPTAVLYSLSLLSPAAIVREQRRPARTLMAVTAVLLTPITLFELLGWLGASTRHLLYDAAVFGLTGILAGYAARRTRVPYTAFLSALALLVAWLFVWDKALGHPSADTFRWLLVAGGAALFVAAAALARAGAPAADDAAPTPSTAGREVATIGGFAAVAAIGGFAAVAAGLLGVLVGSAVGTVTTLAGASSSASSSTSAGSSEPRSEVLHHSLLHTSGLQHPGWNVYLLLVSILLVWIAARARGRGLGYAGALGLLGFIFSAAVQITRLENGHTPTSSAGGWPLVLIILGAVALLAALVLRARPGGPSAGEHSA